MKKLIIASIAAGFISLGFTIINDTNKEHLVSKVPTSQKMDFSHKLDEKRLANWD